MIFASNLVDLCWRGYLVLAEDTSLSGRAVQQWGLRATAQEAALKEIAYSRLRQLLAFSESVACAEVKIGDAALLCNAQGRKSAPRRRGPASILDIDGAGVTGRWRGFARESGGGDEGVADAELDPAQIRFRHFGAGRGDGKSSPSTVIPGYLASARNDSGARFPAPVGSIARHDGRQHPGPSLDEKCAPSRAPRADGTQYDGLAWGRCMVSVLTMGAAGRKMGRKNGRRP